jgi:hypothetical protein
MGIILFSLIPVYLLYKYLQKVIRPQESGRRFLLWLLAELALVFSFTFLLVFVIKLLFPKA